MPKITREQFEKWSALLPEGWKFDLQSFVMWGDKHVYTDGPADEAGTFYRVELRYKDEMRGQGWRAEKTGSVIPRVKVDRWSKTHTEGCYNVVQIHEEDAGEKRSKRVYAELAKLAAAVDVPALLARAAAKDTGRDYYVIGFDKDESADDGEPVDILTMIDESADDAPKTGEEAPQDEQPAAKDAPQEPEEAPQDAPEAGEEVPRPEPQAAPSGFSFAELAAAYIAGRTAKPKLRPEARQEKADEQPADNAPETGEEVPQEAEQPAPPIPGYHDNDNDKFTDEERKALAAGKVVKHGKGYSRRGYFAIKRGDGSALVYSVYTEDIGDDIAPGHDPDYFGFMVGDNIYTSTREITRKMREDIERRIAAIIPDEATAGEYTKEPDEWRRDKLEKMKGYDYTDTARRLFYQGEAPTLGLYTDTPQDINDMIKYIQEPERVIEVYALEYIANWAERINEAWIRYNRISAAYDAIVNDPSREEHEVLRIARSISEQKTVRILLENGKEVKTEAHAVKYITSCGYISDWRVAATDRRLLEGRDIKPADIVAIYHGNKTLYERGSKRNAA